MVKTLTFILFFGFLSVSHASGLTSKQCGSNWEKIDNQIRSKFNGIWEKIESSVGVEFFMLTLKSSERMPSSEVDQATYYKGLLKGIKVTSRELSLNGVSLDSKEIEKLSILITQLEDEQRCLRAPANFISSI